MQIKGVVIRTTGSWYDVEHNGDILRCRIRGRLRLRDARSTNPVVVGDAVLCECDSKGEWSIYDIAPRRNYIIRQASNLSKESHIIAANIDRAMIIATITEPVTATEFIDRFLVTCEAYNVPATILLGKCDLLDNNPQAVREFHNIYEKAGYEVIDISTIDGRGLHSIQELTNGHITLLSGNSGVGKSSLVRSLNPDLEIRTNDISESHHKGRHTTTFSTMYSIGNGGHIIDTPGIKGFGLIDIGNQELWHYFPEMMRYAHDCKFHNCTHTHEPDCAIIEAVCNGDIAESRYDSYLKILDDNDEKYRK